MPSLTTAAAARALAEELLDQGSDRWAHTVGVAAAAEQTRGSLDPGEAELLVAGAWLHDVGYSPAAADTGLHQLDGARFLRRLGAPDRLCRLVAHHSMALVEAGARGLDEVLLAEFPPETSPVAEALTYADMTTGPTGQPLAVADRLAEILRRYPDGHVVHQAITAAAPAIAATVRRVQARLVAAQPR